MIVPLRDRGNLGIERKQILVQKIVFPITAKFCEGLRGLRLFFDQQVLPDFTIWQLDLRLKRDIGVDVIAGMEEKVGPVSEHSDVSPHAAACLVDPPPLARLIT